MKIKTETRKRKNTQKQQRRPEHSLGNDHLTWKGGGYVFLKKNILIPNVAEQNILILAEEKKSDSEYLS